MTDRIANSNPADDMSARSGHDAVRPAPSGPEPKSRNITAEASLVSADDRAAVLKQRPVTLWLTGLSGSGKSTIAKQLEKRLVDAGHAAFGLDGDNVRYGLNRDLGFSAEDRSENIRRVAEVARLMNDAGLLVITSFISPYRDDRQRARETIGARQFVEVLIDTPLDVCEARDPKGLYARARKGDIASFTGVSAPYEPPVSPDLRINTKGASVAESIDAIITYLEKNECLTP